MLFFFQAEDGIRDIGVTGVQTCALPIYPPTVVTGVAEDAPLLREETFGPVAAVRVVDSFEDGLREASATEFGLAAVVLTPSQANAQRAWRELDVGTVKVNAVFGGAPGGAAEPA